MAPYQKNSQFEHWNSHFFEEILPVDFAEHWLEIVVEQLDVFAVGQLVAPVVDSVEDSTPESGLLHCHHWMHSPVSPVSIEIAFVSRMY